MKAFLWEYLSNVTHSYHNGGAVLVIAESLEDAKAQVPRVRDEYAGDPTPEPVGEPDYVWPIEAEPAVFVFEDSGCC